MKSFPFERLIKAVNANPADNITDMPCPHHWMSGKINTALPALATAFLASEWPKRGGVRTATGEEVADLPGPAGDSIAVPPGNSLSCHVYALGVQIFRWNADRWECTGPEAMLFADSGHARQVGVLYAGPTWEADDGSKMNAVPLRACAPFRGAVPWVLLRATPTGDRGTLSKVTYVQGVNTIGGTAPSEPGRSNGEEARVPYTTEYFFYRKSKGA